MLWLLALWLGLSLRRFVRQRQTLFRRSVYGVLILLCMAGQLLCLLKDGLLSVYTALPLHLCSFSGLLAWPALCFNKPFLSRFLNRLGRAGAALALLFPAPLKTSLPFFSEGCFYLLHTLLVFLPLSFYNRDEGAWGAVLLALALVLLALTVDAALGANYLFLREIAQGTPFGFLNDVSPGVRAALFFVLMAAVLLPNQVLKRRPEQA